MFDYETLKVIWWLLVGVLLVGFAIMDGHDMGVGTLLPFAGRNDEERRVIINTVGPHWDGNQVWFITGGGAIFAAFACRADRRRCLRAGWLNHVRMWSCWHTLWKCWLGTSLLCFTMAQLRARGRNGGEHVWSPQEGRFIASGRKGVV